MLGSHSDFCQGSPLVFGPVWFRVSVRVRAVDFCGWKTASLRTGPWGGQGQRTGPWDIQGHLGWSSNQHPRRPRTSNLRRPTGGPVPPENSPTWRGVERTFQQPSWLLKGDSNKRNWGSGFAKRGKTSLLAEQWSHDRRGGEDKGGASGTYSTQQELEWSITSPSD